MTNQSLLDQFFLADKEVAEEMVAAAFINKSDRVLEIGAGTGIITKEIAKKAKKVWAIEIDERFKEDLAKLPGNVEVIYGDALKLLARKPKFNKIVGSLPSSVVEPLTYKLVHLNFEIASFLVPLKFSADLLNSEIFTIYLTTQLIRKVPKTSFVPQPRTNWALVRISKNPPPLPADNERFIRQYLYEHPEAKLKNALREAVIKIYESQGKKFTKNQAREIVKKAGIPGNELENLSSSVGLAKISSCLASIL